MTAEKWTSKSVQNDYMGDTEVFRITFERPDGLHDHLIPKNAFHYRALEYGFDVDDDFDTVLDILLHEPHMQNPHLHTIETDVAAAQGYHTKNHMGRRVPATLYTAETVKDAREAHMLRIEQCKTTWRSLTVDDKHKKKLRSDHVKLTADAREKFLKSVVTVRLRTRGRVDGNPLN